MTASINASGNGIQIQDRSGGSGNLVIADVNGGSTVAGLGIAGTFDTTKPVEDGTRVFTATPEQLQMMLYDGAIRFAEQARPALEKKD